MILPGIGGKIWSAIEKSTGKPFIYDNHVIKFRDVAMRGPWTSGGLEAQAMDAMKNKNFDKALSFIKDAKSGPLNLGVGKPYQADIDERLEDWMTYLCLEKSGKIKEAQQYLKAVIPFTPKVENTVSNFLPANDLITALGLEKTKSQQEAINWLNARVLKYPSNKIIKWCRQVFATGTFDMTNINNSEARIIKSLSLIR